MVFKQFAEDCRRQADEFTGRPEAPFLLKMASAFEELDLIRKPDVAAAFDRPSAFQFTPSRLA